MTKNHETTTKPIGRRIRDTLRYVWDDTNRASEAMFRLQPYDEYLQHERYHH